MLKNQIVIVFVIWIAFKIRNKRRNQGDDDENNDELSM